jgi:SAM-dependent MidA family methyltransferase
MPNEEPASVASALRARLHEAIVAAGGWLTFERWMQIALYEPGLGYYSRGGAIFGALPTAGSDFVTAPEMSPLFGATLAAQVVQALEATGTHEVWEFGAGTGALAEQLLRALGARVRRYCIVDLSGALQARQRHRLAAFGDRVEWLSALPESIEGVVVGNEVLDAMPVTLLQFDGRQWLERGVVSEGDQFGWSNRATLLRPPGDGPWPAGMVTEIHPQAQAFVRTLATTLRRGAAFFIDYGFPEAEYYHPQRDGGTLMCHRAHRADADPLTDAGEKDITAHIDFSAIALAGQDSGLTVLGYTSQARFLLNCGLMRHLEQADLPTRTMAQRLVNEHEMGELFKVIGFVRGQPFEAIGFSHGDRSHRL